MNIIHSKLIKTLLISLSFVSISHADESEKFFYNRGYEKGFNDGYESGVAKGLAIAKNVVAKYKDRIKAYEVGKYLIQEKYLTYPQVWQMIDNDGNVVLSVTPSKIEKELNIDDIFAEFAEIPKKDYKAGSLEQSLNNSVVLSSRDYNANDLPDSTKRDSNISYINIKKTSKNEELLKKANVVFEENKKSYKVIFFSPQEKIDFCKNFKEICK